jgi:hypothetical protein
MRTSRNDAQSRREEPAKVGTHFDSGVVPKALLDEVLKNETPDWPEGEDPPWTIVERYLSDGSHRARIEAHAARSRPFRDVLRALLNERSPRLLRVR